MSNNCYSIEQNVQIIISLMKAHNIKRVIASPGSTNVCLVHSLQNDPDFEMYSAVDERSAGYMACGMAAETGEPVALTCTEATASRNYIPALTEAFYRKLPVLAITATNEITLVGQNHPQMMDRTVTPRDILRKSLFVPLINDNPKKIKGYVNLINDAMMELTRHGGGPVHIEYETRYSGDYTVKELPKVNVTKRISSYEELPSIPEGKIVIYPASHKRWSQKLTKAVDQFCKKYNAVVLSDHINNYQGECGAYYTILAQQLGNDYSCANIDLAIYIGDIPSAYKKNISVKKVWRVNPDGEVRDLMQQYGAKLQYVFEMSEYEFFDRYSELKETIEEQSYLREWNFEIESLYNHVGELPFSNLWIAQKTAPLLPKGSRLYLSIENTMRSWNYFPTDNSIEGYSNTGGFGIDGGVSSLIGASISNPGKLFFGFTGDLAFFYDMNVLGNRHVGNNIRLMIINNGLGQQFRNPGYAVQYLGDDVDAFVAAKGHFGCRSETLLKHYAEDLGYEYLSARNKEEFNTNIMSFVDSNMRPKSMIFEVFTSSENESEALKKITSIAVSTKSKIKNAIVDTIGIDGINAIKHIVGHKLK